MQISGKAGQTSDISDEKSVGGTSYMVFEKRIRFILRLAEGFQVRSLEQCERPFVPAFFAAEEINFLIRVENLKEVALRK